MNLNDRLQELQKRAKALQEEAKSLDKERAGLDPKKDAKRITEINDREPKLHEEVKTVLDERKTLESQIKAQDEFRKDVSELENIKTVNIHRDTKAEYAEGRTFSLDRCMAIALDKAPLTGIERDFMTDKNYFTNTSGSLRLSAGMMSRLFNVQRDTNFSVAGQASAYRGLQVSNPAGLAIKLGCDVRFQESLGVISGVDFFAGPGSTGTTGNATIQTTEIKHDNKPIPVHPQRAAVVMNLSSVLIGGGVSDLGQLQTAANQGIGKWVDTALFGYISEVLGTTNRTNFTTSGGVAVAGTRIDTVYSKIMDSGISTQSTGIVASTDVAGKIRGLTVGSAVPYVQGERIHGIPFYGYPLGGVTVGGIVGAHFEYIQIQATPLTIVPNWTTVTNNTINVNLYADVGAGLAIPSAAWYVNNVKP